MPWNTHLRTTTHTASTISASLRTATSGACDEGQALFHCQAPFFAGARWGASISVHSVVAMRSQRIDLYPVRAQALSSHNRYSRMPKARKRRWRTKHSRPRTTINLPGRQPPRRWRSKLNDRVSTLERGSFGDDAVLDKTPQRDREFSGQRDNADLAAPHALGAEALAPPQRKFAVGLIAEPEPSQLDERLPASLLPALLIP